MICVGRSGGTIVNRLGFRTIKEAVDAQQPRPSNIKSIWAESVRSTVDRTYCVCHNVRPVGYVEELETEVDVVEKRK